MTLYVATSFIDIGVDDQTGHLAREIAGDHVTVTEVGIDNGDINALAGGVLAADGYSIRYGGSNQLPHA